MDKPKERKNIISKGSPAALSTIILALEQSFYEKEQERALTHYLAKGMQNGIAWNYTTRQIQEYKKKHDMSSMAILETVIAGAMWPQARVSQCTPLTPAVCQRCNSAIEDAMHTYWTCPCNLQITDPSVTKTQHLAEEAIAGSQEYPCLWLRGILPQEL